MSTQAIDGPMTDHQLLGAYVQGDELAFETLVEKYFSMVYTVAARRTGDSHLAEEIGQSVFLILSRKARGFSSSISIPGWLLRTTCFVCRDAIKMRLRRERNEQKLAMTLEQQVAPKAGPGELELLLEEAMEALQPEEQAGIVARFFEGKDFHEIAEMFAITEDTARKRTSRCLAKLQAFMEKRGAGVTLETLSGLLLAPSAHEAAAPALQSAIHTAHAIWKGKVAAGNAVLLANHAARLLRWRFLGGLGLKVALPVVLIFVVAWTALEWNTAPARIEKLGQAWGAFDQRVAEHRRFLRQTPPTAPNYQATVQAELAAISRESSRIIGQLKPLLVSPDGRARFAQFLTAGLAKTLNLNAPDRTALFLYIHDHLAQGATLNDAMKALAEATPAEAVEIKSMLSPAQQQVFDNVYGADGVLLFSYAKVMALGKIGP